MADLILDEVLALLKMGKGNAMILERIKRAAEQDEVISHYERSYVADLARTHLGPGHGRGVGSGGAPDAARTGAAAGERAAAVAADEAAARMRALAGRAPAPQAPPRRRGRGPVSLARRLLSTRRRKIVAVAVVALLVAGSGAALVMRGGIGIVAVPTDPTAPAPQGVAGVPPGLSVEADAVLFAAGDIVSISGGSAEPGGSVTLSLTNPGGELIWQEDVRARADRSYSTLTIAGGPGWESAGLYVLDAFDGRSRVTFAMDFAG